MPILLAAVLSARGAAFFRRFVRWPAPGRMLSAAALLAGRTLRPVIISLCLVLSHR